MSQAYSCLPTDLWIFDPTTPKGYYFNKGVFYFGRKVENEMAEAEANSRKNRKAGPGTDRLANSARLGVLERNLGIAIKRHRDPGNVTNKSPFQQHGADSPGKDKDETIVVAKGF